MPQSFSQMGNYPQEKDPKESFDEYWNRPGPWDEKELGSLMDANKAWTDRMTTLNPTYFSDHERGHAPKILWIGCSDARVPANEIIGEPPGNVFVHRNIANQVVNTDFNCMSVIQYAVDVLQVKHIIVCGHYDCGGVKAALVNMDHASPLENWLRNIRNIHQVRKSLQFSTFNSRDIATYLYRIVVISVSVEWCICKSLYTSITSYSSTSITIILISTINPPSFPSSLPTELLR
jgi:carbonic anhydrase